MKKRNTFAARMRSYSPFGAARRAVEQDYALCLSECAARRWSLSISRDIEIRRQLHASAGMWLASARAVREQGI